MSVPNDHPAYRELQRKRVRVSYWRSKPPMFRSDPELLQTDFFVELEVRNEEDLRCGTTITTPLYRVGSVAKILGVNPQSVRLWESQGVMPLPKLTVHLRGQDHRAYTFDQLYAIWQLSPLMNFKDKRGLSADPFFRKLREVWDRMPDGVVPVYE